MNLSRGLKMVFGKSSLEMVCFEVIVNVNYILY